MFIRLKTLVVICFVFVFLIIFHFAVFQHKYNDDTFIENPVPKSNEFDVPSWPATPSYGIDGAAVVVPSELEEKSKNTFSQHQFNLVASDLIGEYRPLPDYRYEECLSEHIPSPSALKKFSTSVIIVFHNEARSTLLRTINSVIYTTPRYLLHEIILVDDQSNLPFLQQELEDYVKTLPVTVKIIRVGKRSGLINARLSGAKVATGGTLTFLDAHCETTIGWLEHAISEIAKNRRSVVCPIIDIISDANFAYIKGGESTWGGFDWDLTFHWYHTKRNIPNARLGDRRSSAIKTPAMAGGLFTIERNYFYEIGSYDSGMEIWGGENVEMSIRIWTCGGQLLINPCSRVGHVFRNKSPYSWPGGVTHILTRNMLRTAQVWMDDYKKFYLRSHPRTNMNEMGDISERVKLREDLQCKPFKWYLEKIYPECTIPADTIAFGNVMNDASNMCLDLKGVQAGSLVPISSCHTSGGNQVLAYDGRGRIRFNNNMCISSNGIAASILVYKCDDLNYSQIFKYKNKQIVHKKTMACLEVYQQPDNEFVLRLSPCSKENIYQIWSMRYLNDESMS